jgi:hypothetical protein
MILHECITRHAQIFLTCSWVIQICFIHCAPASLGMGQAGFTGILCFARKDFNFLTRIAADMKSNKSTSWVELSVLDESSDVLICKLSNPTNKKHMRPYITNRTIKQQAPTIAHYIPSIQMAPWNSCKWTEWWFCSNLYNQIVVHFNINRGIIVLVNWTDTQIIKTFFLHKCGRKALKRNSHDKHVHKEAMHI